MLLALLTVLAPAHAGPADTLTALEQAWASVDLSDGVSADEARTLANAYGTTLISGCGGVLPAEDAGDHWSAQMLVGFAAQPGPVLQVHKTTGAISAPTKPTVQPAKAGGLEVLVPVANTPADHDPFTQAAAHFAKVDLTDGLDEGEARTVANAYAHAWISGCGGVDRLTLAGDTWTATTRVGRGAQPGPTVLVDRTTGAVHSDALPTATPTGDAIRFHR